MVGTDKRVFQAMVLGIIFVMLTMTSALARYSIQYVGLGPKGLAGSHYTVADVGQELILYVGVRNSNPGKSDRAKLFWIGPASNEHLETEHFVENSGLFGRNRRSREVKRAPTFYWEDVNFRSERQEFQTSFTVVGQGEQFIGVCIEGEQQTEDCGVGDKEYVRIVVEVGAKDKIDLATGLVGLGAYDHVQAHHYLTVNPGEPYRWYAGYRSINSYYFERGTLWLETREKDAWTSVDDFEEWDIHYSHGVYWPKLKRTAPQVSGTYYYRVCVELEDSEDVSPYNNCSTQLTLTVKDQ